MPDVNGRAKPAGCQVLCIDDDADVLQVERAILEGHGFAVLLAKSGPDGLWLAQNRDVDLVVLDCEMPRMSGMEVAQRLRAVQPALPIIMLSGGDFSKAVEARIVDCFVPKTRLASTLVQEINRLLGNLKGEHE